jgi:hypothetical protein
MRLPIKLTGSSVIATEDSGQSRNSIALARNYRPRSNEIKEKNRLE